MSDAPRFLEEGLIVALVCFLFLLHVRSALVAILMLPVGVLMAFAAMKALGLGFPTFMSLGGVSIAIGAMMIYAAIVMILNAHKHLERAPAGKPSRVRILIAAASRSRAGAGFSLLHRHRVVPADFLTGGAAGAAVRPAGFLRQDIFNGCGSVAFGDLVPALMIVLFRRPHHSRQKIH